MRIDYPWNKLEKGQGFFIPALDLDKAKEAGLIAAMQVRFFYPHYMYVIKDGLIGVWFYRTPAPVAPT
jgi:hypothetical protein